MNTEKMNNVNGRVDRKGETSEGKGRKAGFCLMQRFMEIWLLVLLYKETCHGYRLSEQLSEVGLGHVNASTLYRTLRKMEANGWVKSSWEQGGKGPRRRVYTITNQGRSELVEKIKGLEQRKMRIETVLLRYEQTIKKQRRN